MYPSIFKYPYNYLLNPFITLSSWTRAVLCSDSPPAVVWSHRRFRHSVRSGSQPGCSLDPLTCKVTHLPPASRDQSLPSCPPWHQRSSGLVNRGVARPRAGCLAVSQLWPFTLITSRVQRYNIRTRIPTR